MSLGDEFQVTLASNVTSNKRNRPFAFETALAKPLDLPGEWEVALIDLSYPHNWTNLDKTYHVVILTVPVENADDVIEIDDVREFEKEIATVLASEQGIPQMQGRRCFNIPAGNYTEQDIVKQINDQIHRVNQLTENNITYNENTHKVTFTQNTKYALAVYSHHSILQLLGLSKQTTTITYTGKKNVEYLILEPNKHITSQLTAHIKRLTSIFVYSDLVELSLVGDSQSALLGYCPIQSKFGEQGYWCFNPPYYVRVREKYINTITIELCTDTGEAFPIEDGKVNCRLNFRRIGLIR